MTRPMNCRIPLTTLLLLALFAADMAVAAAEPATPAQAGAAIDFARDVFPILQQHCADCHGPDVQEGRLRLDARAGARQGGVSGPAIVPGQSNRSLLVKRVTGRGDGDRMPLDNDPLSESEINRIRMWIDQGAKWPAGIGAELERSPTHWAYVKPQRPDVPAIGESGWPQSPLDAFVLSQLQDAGFETSPSEDRERLLRRVTLDLTGLPPTIGEIDAWLADGSPDAFHKIVDRLLASPRYGERWAVPWLDAARYADSNGYQRDGQRESWAWRDWVVRALNADQPFDQFTIEQIAGDLLPGASLAQQIATGFHRNTMANVEAGTDPEEEHVLAVIDRVNTTATVWLGATLECAQCHSHKYDPFSQREYYQLYAFFNNTDKEIESNGSNREFVGPKIALPLPREQQERRQRLTAQIEQAAARIERLTSDWKQGQPAWERAVASADAADWQVLEPLEAASEEGADLKALDDGSLLAGGNFPSTDTYRVTVKSAAATITAFRLEILTHGSLPGGGPGRVKPGNFILSELRAEAAADGQSEQFRPLELASATADHSQTKWPVASAIDGQRQTGWAIAPQFGRPHHADFVLKQPLESAGECVLRITLDQQYGNSRTIGRFRLLAASTEPQMLGLPADIRSIAARPRADRSAKQNQQLDQFYLDQSPQLNELAARQKELEAERDAIDPPTTLVMQELPEPRTTRMFQRGDFLNPGDEVQPGTPRVLHALSASAGPDRLALARWLIADENPLVGRVTVNRQWLALFGRGLVETPEDFGTQGLPPTHPKLLDWLAVEFSGSAERGTRNVEAPPSIAAHSALRTPHAWSLKRLHRLLVTSAVYRQSARVTPEQLRRDPYNELYTRGPRQRVAAETVRDNALAVAGLLSGKVYGPPVFPYQPPGVWNHIGRASNDWTTSTGDDLHRRGLYVYWRRTVPYPSFVNFDAPTREACTVKRSRSNTPLQALTLMNDPVYVESAVSLAGRLLTEVASDADAAERARYAFRLATSRHPRPVELQILVDRYETEASRYSEDPSAAGALLAEYPRPAGCDAVELAAWTHVAGVLLNLDEAVSR